MGKPQALPTDQHRPAAGQDVSHITHARKRYPVLLQKRELLFCQQCVHSFRQSETQSWQQPWQHNR